MVIGHYSRWIRAVLCESWTVSMYRSTKRQRKHNNKQQKQRAQRLWIGSNHFTWPLWCQSVHETMTLLTGRGPGYSGNKNDNRTAVKQWRAVFWLTLICTYFHLLLMTLKLQRRWWCLARGAGERFHHMAAPFLCRSSTFGISEIRFTEACESK